MKSLELDLDPWQHENLSWSEEDMMMHFSVLIKGFVSSAERTEAGTLMPSACNRLASAICTEESKRPGDG